MNINNGRTTLRRYTFGDLFGMFSVDHIGEEVPEYIDIISGNHPLPPITLIQQKGGNYQLIGSYSINLLHTAFQGYIKNNIAYHRRRIAGYVIEAIIIEPSSYQEDVVSTYKKAGLL